MAAGASSTSGVDRARRQGIRPQRQPKSSIERINMPRVNHFEIYTDDPEAVQPFYQDVFGWKFQKFEGGPIEYWLITTGPDNEPGINGGITRPREGQSPATLNTIAVELLDRTMKQIEQRGGKICVPKMAIPKIGWLAYAADPAGNVFGIIEPDVNAK
jgi:predicted enzyme related to lactoylglutathione lyase